MKVIIETHEMGDGTFRADVASGPRGISGGTNAPTREAAFEAAKGYIQELWPRQPFAFLHART